MLRTYEGSGVSGQNVGALMSLGRGAAIERSGFSGFGGGGGSGADSIGAATGASIVGRVGFVRVRGRSPTSLGGGSISGSTTSTTSRTGGSGSAITSTTGAGSIGIVAAGTGSSDVVALGRVTSHTPIDAIAITPTPNIATIGDRRERL